MSFANRLALKLVTAPATEPVGPDLVKRHLGIVGDDQDERIDNLTVAARQMCETHLNRSFITTSWQETFVQFPAYGVITLSRAPLLAVSSITYVDEDEASQTLAASQYSVDTSGEPGRVVATSTAAWPSVSCYNPNPVAVNYTAGYATVPEAIKSAILLVISTLDRVGQPYDKLDTTYIDQAIDNLLASYAWTY